MDPDLLPYGRQAEHSYYTIDNLNSVCSDYRYRIKPLAIELLFPKIYAIESFYPISNCRELRLLPNFRDFGDPGIQVRDGEGEGSCNECFTTKQKT